MNWCEGQSRGDELSEDSPEAELPTALQRARSAPPAPAAPAAPQLRSAHGTVTAEPFGWMADRRDPRLLTYLTAEREYYLAAVRALDPLRSSARRGVRGAPARRGGLGSLALRPVQLPRVHAARRRVSAVAAAVTTAATATTRWSSTAGQSRLPVPARTAKPETCTSTSRPRQLLPLRRLRAEPGRRADRLLGRFHRRRGL